MHMIFLSWHWIKRSGPILTTIQCDHPLIVWWTVSLIMKQVCNKCWRHMAFIDLCTRSQCLANPWIQSLVHNIPLLLSSAASYTGQKNFKVSFGPQSYGRYSNDFGQSTVAYQPLRLVLFWRACIVLLISIIVSSKTSNNSYSLVKMFIVLQYIINKKCILKFHLAFPIPSNYIVQTLNLAHITKFAMQKDSPCK